MSAPPIPTRLFDALERADFLSLEHAPYLKGLLRPFKGTGELEAWASQCTGLRDGLVVLAHRIVSQATAYPFNRLPVTLTLQSSGAGTTFIRWRNQQRSAMGVSLWADLMQQSQTPGALVPELFALELQRIAINMQISLTHTLARQASECAAKMTTAETIYRQRVQRDAPATPKEFNS